MSGWQDISTAPKDGEPVILFARHIDATTAIPVMGWFSEDRGGWIAQSYAGQGVARLVPSHWMPRPEFPTDEIEYPGSGIK